MFGASFTPPADPNAPRLRYQALARAAEAETDPARKAQLLAERDALEDEFAVEYLKSADLRRLRPEATPPDVPLIDPPAPGAAPEAGPAAAVGGEPELEGLGRVPVPSIQQWQAMQGGGGGDPRAAAAARAAATEAAQRRTAGLGQQTSAIERQGDLAEAEGDSRANAIRQVSDALAQQELAHQDRLAAQQRDIDHAQKAIQWANDDFERERQAQSLSVEDTWSEGRRIMATIGLMLGAFAASRTGGRNLAAETLNASINREIEQRRDRLAAAGGKRDAADRYYQSLVRGLGSTEAADAATKAHLLRMSSLKLEEIAAMYGGEDAKAKAGQLIGKFNEDAANEDRKAAAAALKAAQGRRKASAAEAYSSYLDLLTKAEKLNQAVTEVPDYLDADARKRINQANQAEEGLLQLIRTTEAMEAEGREYVPGMEPVLSDPLTRASRFGSKVTGLGEQGHTGLTPVEEEYFSNLKNTGLSVFAVENQQAANYESEREQAHRNMIGSGRLDSVKHNLTLRLERVRAMRRALTRKNTPGLRAEQDLRHQQNPPTIGPGTLAPPAGATPRGR